MAYFDQYGAHGAIQRQQPLDLRVAAPEAPVQRVIWVALDVRSHRVEVLQHLQKREPLFAATSIRTTRFEVWTLCFEDEQGKVPDDVQNIWTSPEGSELSPVLLEDTQFGAVIQKSMESDGFAGVPLSYQEARIYHWNQWADRIIGIENIPEELRVAQVLNDDWLMPNDPRLEEIGLNVSAG